MPVARRELPGTGPAHCLHQRIPARADPRAAPGLAQKGLALRALSPVIFPLRIASMATNRRIPCTSRIAKRRSELAAGRRIERWSRKPLDSHRDDTIIVAIRWAYLPR